MGYVEDIERARGERDRFFATHYASPLDDDDKATFDGLEYFPPDPAWRLEATFREQRGDKVEVRSSNGTTHPYTPMGSVDVVVAGTSYDLVVLDDGDGSPFVPFADATNGDETYGGGRYVGITGDESGRVSIDFNEAHNPYCVYDPEFVCPLPPPSNRIDVRVLAGEKDYHPLRRGNGG